MMDMQQLPSPTLAQRLLAWLDAVMDQRVAVRLRTLLTKMDLDPFELWCGLIATVWGVWLLMPWDTFRNATGYRAMWELAPEWFWGLIILGGGATQLIGVLYDRWRYRRQGTLGMAGLWVFISIMIGAANWTSTGLVVYPGLALANLWMFLRMRLVRQIA